jgi:hypothetical protein
MAGSIAGRDAPALFLELELNDTLKIAYSMAGSIAGHDARGFSLSVAWSLTSHGKKRNIGPSLWKSVLQTILVLYPIITHQI